MRLVVDSIEYVAHGAPMFKSVHLEVQQGQLVCLVSQQLHVSSTLFDIIHFRKTAVNSYIAINGQKLYRKAPNMVLLPAAGLLPKNIPLRLAFAGYDCLWTDFKLALPEFKATDDQTVASLSSGERRMCEIYLCLHLHERLPQRWIFLDQPFQHLSPVFVEKACEWINSMKEKAGILIADTHSERPGLAPDAYYSLHQGRITLS